MFVLAAVALAVIYLVANSRLGSGLNCIKQNEDAANIVGIDTTRYKIYAFALSGGFERCGRAVCVLDRIY